jgi:predicted transcriptional regulator
MKLNFTSGQSMVADEFMTTRLVTLNPDDDALEAIRKLLHHKISGAPVTDADGNYVGVFSEKTSMRFLVDATYSQLPSNKVSAFMDTDTDRIISESTDLLDCMQIFLTTPYRRLPVLRDNKLVGQISRRDVLNAAMKLIDQTDHRSGKFVMYFSALLNLHESPVE